MSHNDANNDNKNINQIKPNVSYVNFMFRESTPSGPQDKSANRQSKSSKQIKEEKSKSRASKDRQLTYALSHETHFSHSEVHRLSQMFVNNFHAARSIKSGRLSLDYPIFSQVIFKSFRITDDKCLEGIFRAFDENEDNLVDDYEWIKGLSVFLRGTAFERGHFCFKAYDFYKNGEISREGAYRFLSNSIVGPKEDKDDQADSVRDMVDSLIRKMDRFEDGKVSLAEYLLAVENNFLMMECLGKVLPDQDVTDAFECTFADKHHASPMRS